MPEENNLLAMHPTDKGLALLTKVIAREIPLKFTRVGAGDGFLPEGVEPHMMAELAHHIRDLPICGKSDGGGVALIDCLQSSKGLAEPYEAREYGLFAEDPDDGEILYAYHNAGDKPDYIPAEGSPIVVDWILSLATVVKRASSIEVTLDHGMAFVTHPELDERLKGLFPPVPSAGVDPSEIAAIWARLNGDQEATLRPIDITLIKQIVLGADTHDVTHMLRSITGQLTWNDLHNRYSRDKVHIELFYKDGVTMSSHLKLSVEEVVTGSDCIDVEDTRELELGLEYLLCDANGQEFVKVKEILTDKRFRTEAPVVGTYSAEGTVVCLSNWTYDDDKDGGAVAQTGQVYQSKPLEMVCNAKGNHGIIVRRDTGEGSLRVERWTGEAWSVCELSESALSPGGYGTPPEEQRMLAIYTLPYVLTAPTKIRVTCTSGPVKVDWIVVKSLFCAAEAPKPRISKTQAWSVPGTYTWTAPAGTTFVRVTAIAGGDGGYNRQLGGHAGEAVLDKTINVSPGRNYTITIGAGGAGIPVTGQGYLADQGDAPAPGKGGNTSFDVHLTLRGGAGAQGEIDSTQIAYGTYGSPRGGYVLPGGRGAHGSIPGSRGGKPAEVTVGVIGPEGDLPSNVRGEAGMRGGGGGSGAEKRWPWASEWSHTIAFVAAASGNGGDGYLELSWEEDGSWD